MRKPRTKIDWSEHKLDIINDKHVLIHDLNLDGSNTHRVRFINTCGVMVVTGDFGNWVFHREFHPTADGYVSDDYWSGKIELASTQIAGELDVEETTKELRLKIDGGLEEEGYSGKELEDMVEYFEGCLNCVDDAFEYMHYAYREYPSFVDHESVVYIKKTPYWLLIIFDAFEEICSRTDNLQKDNEGMNKKNCGDADCEARYIKTYREIEMCRLADNNLYQIALNLTGNKEKYLNSAQELIDKHGKLVARKMSMAKDYKVEINV